MIQVKKLILNPFQENTFVVYDQTGEAVIIDPGCYSPQDVDEVKWFVDANGITIKHLILTHGHIDHILGIDSLRDLYNVKCLAHADDLPLIDNSPVHGLMFGISIDKAPKIDEFIKDGDTISFGKSTIEVIHTPGHSKGGVCLLFRDEKILFTGDTLFNGSIGRTDLQGGNYETLISSIKNKILPLRADTVVYPGHGDPTTVEFENKHNSFLQ